MLNKKLLAAASVAAVLSSSMAFAKTEGHYAGLDLVLSNTKSDINSKQNEINYGVGVNYKYAFNFGGLFVAPEVFYDFNNAEVTDGSDKGELNYSYGVKANVGYDVTEKFAAFVNLGYLETRGTDSGTGYKVDYNLEALTYGIGVTYEAVENVNFKLSYEYVDYLRSGISASLNPDIIKIGVAYNF